MILVGAVLLQGEFTSRFITHWDGGKPGQFVDLRYPGGQRAFHTKPTQAPHNINLDKYAILNPSYDKGDVAQVVPPSKFDEGGDFSASRVLGFSYGQVLPYTEPDRKALAAQNWVTLEDRHMWRVKRVPEPRPYLFSV